MDGLDIQSVRFCCTNLLVMVVHAKGAPMRQLFRRKKKFSSIPLDLTRWIGLVKKAAAAEFTGEEGDDQIGREVNHRGGEVRVRTSREQSNHWPNRDG